MSGGEVPAPEQRTASIADLLGRVDYPFNHGCGTATQMESDIEVWITDAAWHTSEPVAVHLACR